MPSHRTGRIRSRYAARKRWTSEGSASAYIKRRRAKLIDAVAKAGRLPEEDQWTESRLVVSKDWLFCLGGDATVSSQASSWCNELLLQCLLTRLQLSASHPLACQANRSALWDEAARMTGDGAELSAEGCS